MGQNFYWRMGGIDVNGTIVGGMTQQDLDNQTEIMQETVSGESFARFLAIAGQKPKGEFTTLNLAKLLALIGAEGTSLADLGAGVSFFGARYSTAKSVPDAGSVHRKYTYSLGGIFPGSIQADHGAGNATLSSTLVAVSSNGEIHPQVISENVSLPAGLDDTERFGLGKITVAGQVYNGATSASLNFGLGFELSGSGGDPFDTLVELKTIIPTLVLQGMDLGWIGDAVGQTPVEGQALAHADTSFFLRGRKKNGLFHPNGNSNHIKFTMSGLVVPTKIATGQDKGTCELTTTGAHDGTNSPLIMSVNVPIT